MLALKLAAYLWSFWTTALLLIGIGALGPVWGWRWAGAQCVSTTLGLIGNITVVPLAIYAEAWEPVISPFSCCRQIDQWSWHWMNAIWGNPEDGVSGRYAIVWGDGITTPLGKQGPYMPFRNDLWRAWCWQWRNSANALKYRFSQGPDAPLSTGTFLGRTYKVGWQLENGIRVPVGSL